MGFIDSFILNYGYIAIFLILMLGIIGLPIPIPDEVLMLLTGYFTKIGTLDYMFSLFICFIGSFFGMLVSYFIGKKAGRPLIQRFGKWVGITEKRIVKTEKWMHKYGPFSIIVSYFIPGIRHIIFYFCGVSHLRLKTYVLYAGIGAVAWCFLLITVGRIFSVIG